jgi:hypothetical protein
VLVPPPPAITLRSIAMAFTCCAGIISRGTEDSAPFRSLVTDFESRSATSSAALRKVECEAANAPTSASKTLANNTIDFCRRSFI